MGRGREAWPLNRQAVLKLRGNFFSLAFRFPGVEKICMSRVSAHFRAECARTDCSESAQTCKAVLFYR